MCQFRNICMLQCIIELGEYAYTPNLNGVYAYSPSSLMHCNIYYTYIRIYILCGTGGTRGDLLISQLKLIKTVRKEVSRIIPLRRIQI